MIKTHASFTPRQILHFMKAATLLLSVAVGTSVAVADEADKNSPIDIGSRLELFLDDYLIDSIQRLTFELHSPRPAEKVLEFNKPWENKFSSYVVVFQDGDLFRMYYPVHGAAEDGTKFEERDDFTCYAESRDGIHWEKPELGIAQHEGMETNIVHQGGFTSHNFSPFIDLRPGVPADEKYKAIGGVLSPPPEGLVHCFVSADAIHWREKFDGPFEIKELPGNYSAWNQMFWDTNKNRYALYYRAHLKSPELGHKYRGYRHVAVATSEDLVTWSDPKYLPIANRVTYEQLYTAPPVQYFRAPHLYVCVAMRYVATRKPLTNVKIPGGVADGVFLYSRDGLNFDRRYDEAFIRAGLDARNWSRHGIVTAWGILPTGDNEMSVYYTQNYSLPTAYIRRGVLRTDGFVSLRAKSAGGEIPLVERMGEFTTKPLIFTGQNLVLNVSTSAVGGVRVEVQNADREPIDGFRLQECQEYYGDAIDHVVDWEGDADLAKLAGTPVRLRFVMHDADLYSMRFQ